MVLTKNITSPSLYLYWKLCSIKKRYCTFFHKYRFITCSNKTFPSTRNNFKTRFISKCDLQFVSDFNCYKNCLYFLFHTFYKIRFMFLQKLFCFYKNCLYFLFHAFYKNCFVFFLKTVCTFCFMRFTKTVCTFCFTRL